MNTKICIGGYKKVWPSEILLFEADENYSKVYFKNGEATMVATNLGKIEQRFAATNHFFRPNRSAIVNLHFAEYCEKTSQLVLQNQQVIGVSYRRKPQLLKYLNQNK